MANGWQPGGFNTAAFNFSNTQFRPEVTTAWEIGIKGRFADVDAAYTLAAFRNDIRDYQDLVFSEIQLESYIANARRARTQGVESQFAWQCTSGLRFGTTLGTTHTAYEDDLIDPLRGVRLDSRPLGQVPRYTYNVHAQYSVGAWLARAEVAGAGSFEVHDYNETAGRMREQTVSGYSILNAKIGYHSTPWSVYLYGSNLGNRRYFTAATLGFGAVALYPWAAGNVAPPRTLGVELRWDLTHS